MLLPFLSMPLPWTAESLNMYSVYKSLALTSIVCAMLFFQSQAIGAYGQEYAVKVHPQYFNLGPIGAKAELVTKDSPKKSKSALVMKQVFAKGPADEAGVEGNDVVYGVGVKAFGKDAYLELAKAINDLEGTKDKESENLVLLIKRKDEFVSLKVKLKCYGDGAGDALPGQELHMELLAGSLKYLAKKQQADGSYECTLSYTNGQVVITSLAGLAFLASGSTAEKGKYSKNLLKPAEYVLENVGEQKKYRKMNGKNTDQSHWSLGYGGIFLAEMFHASDEKWLKRSSIKRLKSKLKKVAAKIVKNMEDSGGFAAGPGGENLLGYVELEIMSNFCLAALGCIEECGVKIKQDAVDKMIAYVRKCDDGEGGIFYSTANAQYQYGEVGRSAGALNALASLGKNELPLYGRMSKYLRKNLARTPFCHSTPTMHHLSVAMAAKRDSKETFENYWKENRLEFTMLRNPDGTFTYRPNAESMRMKVSIDRDLRDTWTTAHWALILSLSKDVLPLWSGSKRLERKASEKKPEESEK